MRALIVVLACSCTSAQVRRAHAAGEVTAGGALVAMLAAVVLAEAVPSARSDLLDTGAVFVPISMLGALVYAATDEGPAASERAAPRHPASWEAAMELAKQAKHAARRGDCAEVQSIEPRVRELDSEVYRRFLHDDVIGACLGPAPAQ